MVRRRAVPTADPPHVKLSVVGLAVVPAGCTSLWTTATLTRLYARRATIDPTKAVEVSSLHLDIAKLAAPRIAAGHGNDAALRAHEAIERRVQSLSSRTEIGKELMSKAFRICSSLMTGGQPTRCPRARAAARPSWALSTINSRINSATAMKTWKTSRLPEGVSKAS